MLRLSYGDGTTSAWARAQQRMTHVVGHVAERADARMLRNAHLGRPGEDQRDVCEARSLEPGARSLRSFDVLLEVVEQRVAALVAIDAAEIEHVAIGQRQRAQHAGVGRGWRQVETHADDRRRLERRGRRGLHERGFLRRQEEVPGGQAEEVLQHVEVERSILLGRRHQHRAIGDQRQAEEAGT